MINITNLANLKKHTKATVVKIDGSLINPAANFLSMDIEQRLLEIGFTEGSTITVMHRGFLGGNPIAIRIDNRNSLISLRKEEAAAILVTARNV